MQGRLVSLTVLKQTHTTLVRDAKAPFSHFRHFRDAVLYYKCHQFTKTGSGQT